MIGVPSWVMGVTVVGSMIFTKSPEKIDGDACEEAFTCASFTSMFTLLLLLTFSYCFLQ